MKVAVLDYGFGNVRSAVRALARVGAEPILTADFDTCLNADGLVVPGVGAFAACMAGLRSVRGDWLIDRRLSGGRPVLGICVGMQVMFTAGLEDGRTEGLGEWPGEVRRLRAEVVPHIGWNTVQPPPDSILLRGLADQHFYFVHSYAVVDAPQLGDDRRAAPLLSWATYGETFLAAVENGPLTATQFHPEKSGEAGLALLGNWLSTL